MKSHIINLTQHPATGEQQEQGVVDLPEDRRKELCRLLTFEDLPSALEVARRASEIVELISDQDFEFAMVGGAPFLMPPLVLALRLRGIQPMAAFSRRESIEEPQADGSVRKTSVFRHVGFVDMF